MPGPPGGEAPPPVQVCYACVKAIAADAPRPDTVRECTDTRRHKGRYHAACADKVASCLYCREDVVQKGDLGVCHLLSRFGEANQADAALMYR
jgi:hypothetical protein